MCGGSKRDGTWREEAGEGALSSERHSRSICWSCASRTAASAGRESLRADCRPEKTSCRSSTRVMARARNCWCRDPARDDGPFPIAAAIGELGWKSTEWMGSWLFSFPPLASRAVLCFATEMLCRVFWLPLCWVGVGGLGKSDGRGKRRRATPGPSMRIRHRRIGLARQGRKRRPITAGDGRVGDYRRLVTVLSSR